MSWQIKNDFLSQESIPDNGNRLLVGNGNLGIRGTLDEHGKVQLTAINLAGIYDQVGDGWREPLNAPNPLHTLLTIDGTVAASPEKELLEHLQGLDYRHGIYSRQTGMAVASNGQDLYTSVVPTRQRLAEHGRSLLRAVPAWK